MKTKKICTKCFLEKVASDFSVCAREKDGLQSWCKSCQAEYRNEHKTEIAALAHRRWTENIEEMSAYNRKYSATHKKEKAESDRRYRLQHKKEKAANERKRMVEDTEYKLACSLRRRINIAIKRGYKSGSAVRDLGCSISELVLYLEARFSQGMNWENWARDGWHIDHRKPLASFDLTDREQFKQACHYTNLQPLWAKENLSKGAST